ncbi:outer membrane lipoprotein carrier protein LolA [Lysobacter olei]
MIATGFNAAAAARQWSSVARHDQRLRARLTYGMRVLMLSLAWLLAATPTLGLPSAAVAGQVAAPATALAQVQRRIAQVPVLRGEFAQEKRLQGFKNPLRSQGRFLIARERGVRWSTLKPFPSDVALTRDRILTRQADGRSRVEVDARQQPALRSVNAMMFALMSGDVQTLTARFSVQATLLADNGWRLVLTPKPGAMAQAFQRVTLEGDRYVRRVDIEERSGDRTQLTFTSMVEAPARLTADEARRFD